MPFSLSRRPCDALPICGCEPKFDGNLWRFTPPPLPCPPKLKMELFTEYSCVLWYNLQQRLTSVSICFSFVNCEHFLGNALSFIMNGQIHRPFLRSCFENLICHTWCTNERQWVMLLPNVLKKLTLLCWERPINQTWRTSWQRLILTLQCTPWKAPWKVSYLH